MVIEGPKQIDRIDSKEVNEVSKAEKELGKVKDPKSLANNIKETFGQNNNEINSEKILSPEEQDAINKKKLFNIADKYINDPNFGEKGTDFIEVKDLLLKIYPKDFKEKDLSTPRKIESAMKKKVSDFTKFLSYTDTNEEKGLTEDDLSNIKKKVSEEGPTSDYLFDGKMKYEKIGEKEVKIDGSQIVGEWNFVAKDTSYEDLNTMSLVKDNVQKLQTQLAQFKNNPNIDPESIRVVINSSASNLRYNGEGGNQYLADERAQNVQKMILENFGGEIPQLNINSEVTGPAYPPKIEDLQKSGFDSKGIPLEKVVANYQDPNINKMLEEQFYRPYQNVNVSLDYKEIKKEPLYKVESKKSIYKGVEKEPLNSVVHLFVDQSLLSQIDGKEKEKIVDAISDPNIKRDFELNFLNKNPSAGFKININTGFTNGINLFNVATQTSENMRHNRQAAQETSSNKLYEYQGRDVNDNANVEASKVTTKEIKDIAVLKKIIEIAGNPESTDKELINFVKTI